LIAEFVSCVSFRHVGNKKVDKVRRQVFEGGAEYSAPPFCVSAK